MEIEVVDFSVSVKFQKIKVVYRVVDKSGDAIITNASSFNLKFPENRELYVNIIKNIKDHIKKRIDTDDIGDQQDGRAILLEDDDEDDDEDDEVNLLEEGENTQGGDSQTMVRYTLPNPISRRTRRSRPRRRRRRVIIPTEQEVSAALRAHEDSEDSEEIE